MTSLMETPYASSTCGSYASSLKKGVAPADAVAKLENERLKKENRQLKAKLDRQEKKAPDLTGQGGMQEKDPFAMGFLQAMNNY